MEHPNESPGTADPEGGGGRKDPERAAGLEDRDETTGDEGAPGVARPGDLSQVDSAGEGFAEDPDR